MMRNDSENSNLKTQYKQQHTVELVVLGPVPDTDRPGRALSTEWPVASALLRLSQSSVTVTPDSS